MINSILNVILEQGRSNWCACTPDEIGVVAASGSTREDTIANFRLALKSHIKLMQQEGLPVPSIEQLNIQAFAAV